MINKKTTACLLTGIILSAFPGIGTPTGILYQIPAEETSSEAVEVYEEGVTESTTEEIFHMPYYETPPQSNSYEDWPQGPLIEGTAGIVMDLDTSAILYEKNIDTELYPASITKMMTGLIACERLNFSDSFTMTESAAYGIEAGSSTIYGDVNEVFTVEQALMGLMLESANEMALALAEQTSGSVKKFVELMNQRARELGCVHTHFNNPNGLPDETHYTSARDMALICQACWMNQEFRRYFTTDYYEIPPTNIMKDTRYVLNHHRMMPGKTNAYQGVLGGKTGYTQAAGNTLVTFARRNKLNLVVVVLGSLDGAYADTAALLDYAFGSFEHLNLKLDLQPVPTLLPAEQYLIKSPNERCSFPFRKAVVVTVPVGTKRTVITKDEKLITSLICSNRIRSTFFYHGHPVGYGFQYEEPILQKLVNSRET